MTAGAGADIASADEAKNNLKKLLKKNFMRTSTEDVLAAVEVRIEVQSGNIPFGGVGGCSGRRLLVHTDQSNIYHNIYHYQVPGIT